MGRFTAACVQMTTGIDPQINLENATRLIERATSAGAQFIATPEMTGCMNIKAGDRRATIYAQSEDPLLKAFQDLAKDLNVTLLIGSLAFKAENDERMANRSCLISSEGSLIATYDKIHMFDVEVGDGQTYRESNTYRPGETAMVANTPHATLGLSICYDLRFPHLYRQLAQNGAQILTCPAAFTKVTGEAHWHTLLRARAIETGSFVIAPAQSGLHEDGRETFGHSLMIDPWGQIVAESTLYGEDVILAEIDPAEVEAVRGRIPSLRKEQPFTISKK